MASCIAGASPSAGWKRAALALRISGHQPFALPHPLRLLGVSAKNGYVMNSVAIPRIPGESIGGICRLTSPSGTALTLNVEYNQLEPLLKETPAGGDIPDDSGYSPYPGNINVLLFHLPRYSECLDGSGGIVPEFINRSGPTLPRLGSNRRRASNV